MDRSRIQVDFNETVQSDLVLLSKSDVRTDSDGKEIFLSEGLPVFVYEFNHYADDTREYILADGTAELNDPEENGEWSATVKWCCRVDQQGIRVITY